MYIKEVKVPLAALIGRETVEFNNGSTSIYSTDYLETPSGHSLSL